VTEVGIFGYSQGGGATQMLAETLNANGFNVDFAAYIDAVDHDGSNAENDYPNGVDYLLNIYQENGLFEFGGGPVDTTDMQLGEVIEEINVTADAGWDHTLEHSLIDDDAAVQQRVKSRLDREIDR
jgi:hypothetical protein